MTVKRYVEVSTDPAGDNERHLVNYVWAKHPNGKKYNIIEVNKDSVNLYYGCVDATVNKKTNNIHVRDDFDWKVSRDWKLSRGFNTEGVPIKFWVRFEKE